MAEFENKVVAITGGTSGIGLDIAKKFVSEKAKVSILGRNKERLKRAQTSLKNVLAIQGDVTKISDLDQFFQKTNEKFGNIDVLVASAGVADFRNIKDVDEAFFDYTVNINYKGLYFTVQRALPFLNSGASVILISSAAAHLGWRDLSVYCSTKAAVSHLARCLTHDLLERNIRVNAISPGFVKTEIFDTNTPEEMEAFHSNIPVKRFALPKEITEAVLFLASPRSSYIVGSDLVIDGGLIAVFKTKT